jgi:predicted ATPase
MARIKISNIGPIKAGFEANEGWIELKKVTLLIGNQGAGKSVVAKLYATFAWIEKSLVIGTTKEEYYTKYNRFTKLLEYHRIQVYLNKNSSISYEGKAYHLSYQAESFTVKKVAISKDEYLLPKIMYVPSERNFLSAVIGAQALKGLPKSLYDYFEEYDRAQNKFWNGVQIPINGVEYRYDRQNGIAHIGDGTFSLRLSDSSSGFQSTVPMILVSKYLAELVNDEEGDEGIAELSIEKTRKLEKELKAIIDDPKITAEVRQALLRELSNKIKPRCFINIVEEPEQNLFPTSQSAVLNYLLSYNNLNEGNQLLLTTHSPYLLNALTIVAKAYQVRQQITDNPEAIAELDKIAPESALLDPKDLAIYQLDEKTGTIAELDRYDGLPSDDNYLNNLLNVTNDAFTSLLKIEKGWL